MKNKLDYIVFILTLAFTTFEYFFREDRLFLLLAVFAIAVAIYKGFYRQYNTVMASVFIIILVFWSLIQATFIPHRLLITTISLGITMLGTMSIAMIVKDRFVTIFVTTMYYISIIAIVIYLLCLDPSLQNFFINDLTKNFTSLNVETAVFEGGGKNFIIHNFAAGDTVLEATDMLRNCGPFWEPGMFAVFLNIALFLHNVIERQKLRFCNLILIGALVTTFSTGGFLSGLIILLSYIFSRKNHFISIIFGIIFVLLAQYLMRLEFVGEKLTDQMTETEIGSDVSRFSAYLTQIEMIKNSPVLGGENISDYLLYTDTKTLASGTLLPYVFYGIPVGAFYVIMMLISFIKLAKSKGRGVDAGVLLFISLLILSFSQTILLSNWMLVMIFVGMITKNNKYYGCKI